MPSSTVHEHQDDFRHSSHSRASTPRISLSGPSQDATYDAGQWLSGLLFKTPDIVHIYNNFIMHFGEEEHQQLSQLMNQKRVIITESLESGRASISVCGDLTTNVVVAVLQVEAMLCKIQREFIQAEEHALFSMLKMNLSFETSILDHSEPSNMRSSIKHEALQLVKVRYTCSTSCVFLYLITPCQPFQTASKIVASLCEFPLKFT